MPRYFAHLSYKGTHFHGWQLQPNADTVQERLNKALKTICRQDVETVGVAGQIPESMQLNSMHTLI